MQIIGCQPDIVWEDKAANHGKIHALVSHARPAAGALVVLPEMFATGFSMKVARVAEGDARPSERFMAALAQEFQVYVQGGVVNRGADGRGLNQSVTFAPDGTEAARYTKIHPFSFAKEDRHYAGGDGPIVFAIGEWMIAPTVCYDLRFPEIFRAAVRRGALLYTVIANWPAAREQHWLTLLQARAIENQAYVVGVNRCGSDPWLPYSGRSLIVDPRGKVLADAGNGEGTISVEADLAGLQAYRREFPALADIRPRWVRD
ncbi:MAG: carbon-nitrogen family hydrolase [Pseudomonadota bacterium]|nr:carbon-nitrogen family hydrolase [Pseudomonadota bacterium]